MVNRRNYFLCKQFLEYLREVRQVDRVSADRYWSYLKQLLLWAESDPLSHASEIQPVFATYLTSARMENKLPSFAPLTLKKIFQTAKRFFAWAKSTNSHEFHSVQLNWIEALRLPKSPETQRDHEFVKLDEVLRLAALPILESDFATRRDQAAVAMLFLSGMRAGAFTSLKIACIDLATRAVKQWPSLGIKTKNSKSATTYLLNIPPLLAVVESWDAFIRPRLNSETVWYTPIISQWGEQTLSNNAPGANRGTALAKRLRILFAMAELPYRSPHKFRHGHAVFALQHASTMADYKAVSMNLMHGDIRVTDSIYAPLARDEVKERIAGLTGPPLTLNAIGECSSSSNNTLSNEELLKALAERLHTGSAK